MAAEGGVRRELAGLAFVIPVSEPSHDPGPWNSGALAKL